MSAALAYRVVSPAGGVDEWCDDAALTEAAVARRLGIAPGQVEMLRRRITVDPVVVRHDGSRWRSRQAWSFRSESASAHVFEMLRIDEALYDH